MSDRGRTNHHGRSVALGRPRTGSALTAFLVGVAVALAGVPSHAGPPGSRVEAIRVSETDGDTSVVITTSQSPTFTTWKLERPVRVVVEISGARLGDVEVPFDAATFALGTVAASTLEDESGPRTRVVLTLRQAADYKIEARGRSIVLGISPQVKVAPAVAGSRSHPAEDLAEERRRAEAARLAAAGETKKLAEERSWSEGTARKLADERAASEKARREAEQAQHQAHAERERTEKVLQAAAADVETRRQALEAASRTQQEQQRKLLAAERVVAEREVRAQQAAEALAARERAVADAAAKLAALEKTQASVAERERAARQAAEAERDRRQAISEAERRRADLAEAVAARQAEESQRKRIEEARRQEERRLGEAMAARTAEEARRQAAAQARETEERRLADLVNRRAEVDAERAALQARRDALAAEVRKLEARPTVSPSAPATTPPAPERPPLAAAPVSTGAPSPPVSSRTRSITLRVPSRIQRVDFVDEPSRSSVIIDLDEPSSYSVERRTDRRLTLRLLHADLPRGLERSLDATQYLGPVRVISAYRDPATPRVVRIDVDLAEAVPSRVRRDGNRLYWDFQKALPQKVNMGTLEGPRAPVFFVPARKVAAFRADLGSSLVQAQAAGAEAMRPGSNNRKRYTGRRVDLDFKSADIHNILRLLADIGQVNVITSDDVRGEVTIKMRDVPWDQALDVVLRGKQLGSVREGNLIRVAPLTVLEKELEQEIARQRQMTEVLPTETRLIGVSYATAGTLQARAKDLLSSRGKISVDDRTNNLIVSDVAKNLSLIEELIRNLDTQTSQVVIEARIVEARSTFSRQFGIQWGGTGFMDVDHGNPTGLVFPYNFTVGGGSSDGQTPVEGLVPRSRNGYGGASPNFLVNLPVAAGTGAGSALGITMGSVAGAFNLNLRLSALETTGQIRVLSSPRIVTLDNLPATIEQGVAIPISVVSAAGVQTVFVDAKLNLSVTPHVTNEGTVLMEISVTRNEPDFANTGARGDPTILKKEAKTNMLVRDGDTGVIGGIYTRNSGINYSKIPFFADIPVLGIIFRNRRENDDRTEFLVFITPRIVNRARALGQ